MMLGCLEKYREAYSKDDANYNYALFSSQIYKIMSSWNYEEQLRSKVQGDEIHVGSLTQSESSKKKHFI